VEDPAAIEGTDEEKQAAFRAAAAALKRRIDLLIALPEDKLDRASVSDRLKETPTLHVIGYPENIPLPPHQKA
jgi:arsenate reductase